ncbi:MAG: Uncharacterised protein [Bacteroidetes bacterium MED-G17]|nr:MAG: Uncharacterised protein [Bacteroidetes bacterium MED-G17]
MVEDVDTVECVVADEVELLIRVPKCMKRTQIDKTLNLVLKNTLSLRRVGKNVIQIVQMLGTAYQSQPL